MPPHSSWYYMRTGLVLGVIVAVTLLSPGKVLAQRDFVQHERSATPSDSRYELIQSTLAVRSTYRIDKVLGRVDQLVMRDDSTLTWQRVPRPEHPAGDPQVSGRVNYQVFLSGIANRHTYLMNVNNGATWQLAISRDEILVWDPIT